MADVQLDALESRIESLENLVFGSSDKDAIYPRVSYNLTATFIVYFINSSRF